MSIRPALSRVGVNHRRYLGKREERFYENIVEDVVESIELDFRIFGTERVYVWGYKDLKNLRTACEIVKGLERDRGMRNEGVVVYLYRPFEKIGENDYCVDVDEMVSGLDKKPKGL